MARLHQQHETGAVFAITQEERLLVIAFVEGEIKGMRFGLMTGAAVIPVLETIDIKSFSVKTDKSIPSQTLPATTDILNRLSLRIPIDILAMALNPVADSATDTVEASVSQPKRVVMYRGHAVEPEPSPAGMPQQRVMTYRGQVVGEAPTPKTAESEHPTKKSVRMYRGQIIA
ncbi:MAG: hypothetical protein HC805_02665 [Alkalinema sp. RL_2_19]|nr:hypothetical protein [Alkalinema sp. RL_2_19]